MKGPAVLLTGATGFLGNHIARELLQQGYTVRALLRKSSDETILTGLECDIVRVDFLNSEHIEAEVSKVDFVIHAAALTAQGITDFEVYRQANIAPVKLLVNACLKNPVKRFVFVSTANSFTPGTIQNPGQEDSGFMSRFANSGYAFSKYLAQQMVLKKASPSNFPALVVAPTFMIGPNDVKPSSGALILYVLKNKVLFYPRGGKSFVDVRAAATATVNALQKGRIGEAYLLAGENISYKDFYSKTAAIAGKDKILLPIPKTAGKLVKSLSRALPFNKLKLLGTNINTLLLDNYFSNEKAGKELDMPQTSLQPAIEETIHWFRQNGYIK